MKKILLILGFTFSLWLTCAGAIVLVMVIGDLSKNLSAVFAVIAAASVAVGACGLRCFNRQLSQS